MRVHRAFQVLQHSSPTRRASDVLTDLLLEAARSALKGHEVEVRTVPGGLEVPAAIARASETGRYDGYVALGVVIRGETYHFEIVAGESARGLMALTLEIGRAHV